MAGDASAAGADAPSSSAAAATVAHGLYWPQNHELAQISIPDLLGVVSRNALAVIRAERCVVFMYDKTSNLLTAQVSSGESAVAGGPAVNTSDEDEDELSFPPVMGLVSACFLQRRCMRMQEPNLHKSFHREYDVPKDMAMDSIIVAPVTLHHRTVGVIELLNRVDSDAHSNHAASESPHGEGGVSRSVVESGGGGTSVEDYEVKLLRTRAVQQKARAGFSAKDEQKMIQFTSHVAQLLDNKLKLLAQVESAAKLREERAQTAIELLNMMNETLAYQATAVPVASPRPKRLSIPRVRPPVEVPMSADFITELSTVAIEEEGDANSEAHDKPLHDLLGDVDILKVMVGISRTQAVFRGHHLRKVHRLSEALKQHRVMRRKVRSALVIQRATRSFLARRWRKKRRNAILVIAHAIKSYKMRVGLAERLESKKKQNWERSAVAAVAAPASPQHGDRHKLVQADVQRFRQRHASAMRIQQKFRGHRERKEYDKGMGYKRLTKGLTNIVKLQSLLRGSIARKKFQTFIEQKRAARAANVVCMRLASTASQPDPEAASSHPDSRHVVTSRDCLYPLPVLPTGAHVVANRYAATKEAVEETFDELRGNQFHNQASTPGKARHRRRRRLGLPFPSALPQQRRDAGDAWICPQARPLAPTPLLSPRAIVERQTLIPLAALLLNRSELARQHPSVVFEVDAKRAKRCAAGVQHADDWLPKPRHRKMSFHKREDTEMENVSQSREASSNFFREQTFGVAAGAISPASNQATGLPRLFRPVPPLSSPPQPSPLQVCFVPAGNARRATARLSDVAIAVHASRPPTQPTPSRLPSTSHRRALTTR